MIAFESAVERHGPTVLRVCRAVLGPADAEDAWAETFLAALAAYDALPDDTNLEAWLVTVAHRKALDGRRAAQRRAVPTERLPERGRCDPDPTEHDPVYAALAALPPKQRQAVAYHHLGGLSHREVAALLGGTEAAARRACADGITTLRRTLR